MFGKFQPDFSFSSIEDIKADFFTENGIRFALLDVDNTLVGYKTEKADERARIFLEMLTENGIKYALVSNNHSKRVGYFAEDFDALFVSRACKPFIFGINRAMKSIGAQKDKTVLIGDQVFTDVYAGKRAGIKTVMVTPIDSKETPFFGVKRFFERIVLKNHSEK